MPRPTLISGLSPETRLTEAARRLLAARLADVRRYEDDALAGRFTEDGVHDLRVAVRRLRAPLRLFRDLGPLARLEREAKRLQDALGEVRDIHVQRAWLAEAERREKPGKRAALAALRAQVERPLGEKERRLKRALTRWVDQTVPALVRETTRLEALGKYGGRYLREQIIRQLRKVRRRMKAYERAPDGLAAHELRKDVKKLRYEVELLRPALPRKIDTVLEVLEPLQEMLGTLHDADVRLQMLERSGARGTPAERAAAGQLLERVREERAAHALQLARELERWRAEALARSLRWMLSTRR